MSDPGAPPPPPPDDTWRPPPPPAPPYGGSDPPPYGQAPPPPPAYGQPPTYTPYGNPQQPAYGGGYGYPMAPPQTEGTAIGALIASIVAWMVCPVIPAIVALVMIPGAKRKIDQSQGRLTGEGLLTAAKWVAWINIAFYGLLAVLFLVLIVIGVLAESSSTSSEFSLGALRSR